ncbi:DUF418 domain-containing protein [Corynebacterium pacaense]|uniref:DUF418 domain-containing protein n=1 Tax=Corynebacterium pacaense TaxID=1816684 RepID=UPI0009B96AE2|nr:heparan-alpha-glucosaminide N-acetyltransferase domain-containing protein [Corynebacterium pacaense]
MTNQTIGIEGTVPEGDLPQGTHPVPGRREWRPIWSGRGGESIPQHFGSCAADTTDPRSEFGSERQMRGSRIIGIDVARMVALIGMILAHTLPTMDPETAEPTFVQIFAGGNASALFALLAGIGITLTTRRAQNRGFGARQVARTQVVVRAALILFIGLSFNSLVEPLDMNILPYYSILFLMTIPFLFVRRRVIIGWIVFCTIVGPLVQYAVRARTGVATIPAPVFSDFLSSPVDTFTGLLFTGTYPVTTWVVYILIGLLVGRLALNRLQVQLGLLGAGTIISLLGFGLSRLLVSYAGGFERMLYSTEATTAAQVREALHTVPDTGIPTSSLWWLTTAAPHANTPFSLLHSIGVAMAVLGAVLLLCRLSSRITYPLSLVGSMTLTLYVIHLTFLDFIDVEAFPNTAFAIQVLLMFAVALSWRSFFAQGPLEWVVSRITKSVGPRRRSPQRVSGDPEPMTDTGPVPPRGDAS